VTICCPKSIKACSLRITRLNASDIPLDPLVCNSRIQTAGFMELGLTPDIEGGTVTETRSPGGDLCIVDRECSRLKGFNLELKMCGVPLPVLEMLIGVNLMVENGDVLGAAFRNDRAGVCTNAVMLELWSKNADKGTCDIDGTPANLWIQWVLGRTFDWSLTSNLTFNSGVTEFALSGYAQMNPWWFPSLPGAGFPSYVPGGGDPAGLPTGPPDPVLPDGITPDPWTLDDMGTVRLSGPLGWKCVDALPSPIDDCGYLTCEAPGPV